jgi:hypothetical protein
LSGPHKNELSSDVIRTINIIFGAYERASTDDASKAISTILAGKLLATSSIGLLRPKPTQSKGRDINADNYLEHFSVMEQAFVGLPVLEGTRLITRDITLPGIRHLITHIDEIVEHVMKNFGVLYYLASGHVMSLREPIDNELLSGALYIYERGEKLLYSLKTPKDDQRNIVFNASETLIAEISALIDQN